jgi:hypothetical protein
MNRVGIHAEHSALKMRNRRFVTGLLLGAMALLSGCTSSVRVEQEFPTVVSKPMDMSAVLVLDREFRNYQARPNSKTQIQIGASQVDLFRKAFDGLFSQVKVVSSREDAGKEADLVIIPSVREVQLSTPSESYLNVYEVWIKYNLDIETVDNVPVDSWFLPAYGKTPDSYLLSRTVAIEQATIVALRDAGAKLMLDFFRIPAINGWLQQREAMGVEP